MALRFRRPRGLFRARQRLSRDGTARSAGAPPTTHQVHNIHVNSSLRRKQIRSSYCNPVKKGCGGSLSGTLSRSSCAHESVIARLADGSTMTAKLNEQESRPDALARLLWRDLQLRAMKCHKGKWRAMTRLQVPLKA